MLLFLAPTLLLLPGQNVSAADGGVVEEVTATFSFTEPPTNGTWWPFTAGGGNAGGGGIQPPGPCLEQYTRAVVTRDNTTLPGCEFRNYTTGSGNVSGDLSGTLSLAWLTFNFNQTYPYTPKYNSTLFTATMFGFMMGRGHFYATNTSNNFTIVFVADFDSNNATMGNAVGKGFMLSANETGIFAGRKIIGDFNITKTGASYSGTFYLRNYAPNEVYDLSWLNVTGGVLQEQTDEISTPLALLDYMSDGPQVTPSIKSTDFEEIAWGRDPIKNVTSGHLGINGTMDLSRDTALYLEVHETAGYVCIQGTTACNLFINDTYAVTGDDDSTYGKLYELLLLYIPYQNLTVGDFFKQYGYTFTPVGMLNPSTDCYAGTESYALAMVAIQSAVGTAEQWSTDHSYGLYPTPKVTSVTPNTGAPGETNKIVTIKGKYFLRAAGENSGWVPSAGSVSFGPNVTVNSYTIKNSSPIDNEITANITIAGGATAGPIDVNVTSCFGYNGTGAGSGAAPYETGTLTNGFTITAGVTTLSGHVDLSTALGAAPKATWVQTFVVKGFAPNSTPNATNALWTRSATTDTYGVFSITDLTPGTYKVGIKNCTCLSELETGVVLTEGNLTEVYFDPIREGDCSEDDAATAGDRGLLYDGWNSANIIQSGHLCDLNRDGGITAADRGLLYDQWNKGGAAYGAF